MYFTKKKSILAMFSFSMCREAVKPGLLCDISISPKINTRINISSVNQEWHKHKHKKKESFPLSYAYNMLMLMLMSQCKPRFRKQPFKNKIHQFLLAVLGNEDDYVEVSALMLKITNCH